MRETLTARQLAEYSELARKDRPYNSYEWAQTVRGERTESAVIVEVMRGGGVARLSDIRFAVNEHGRRTTKLVDCLVDGQPTTYDSKYEFQVIAVTKNGLRLDGWSLKPKSSCASRKL